MPNLAGFQNTHIRKGLAGKMDKVVTTIPGNYKYSGLRLKKLYHSPLLSPGATQRRLLPSQSEVDGSK